MGILPGGVEKGRPLGRASSTQAAVTPPTKPQSRLVQERISAANSAMKANYLIA
jgi:hypothetical protein